MFLGQCMQMQCNAYSSLTHSSDTAHHVPFRQCKLTELLFSNSVHSSTSTTRHQSQKAIMIVTADPRGDFNATSQILRYSALAREVTVPRIPSVTSQIMSGLPSSRPETSHSSHSSAENEHHTAEEISRVNGENAVLRLQLEEATRRYQEAEASWARCEERLEDLEAEVREECWSTFEERLRAERERWAAAWDLERDMEGEHLDRKMDIAMRGVGVDAEGSVEGVDREEALEGRVEELERENDVLREKVLNMERERTARTPSRKLKVLKARRWDNMEEDQENVSP